MRRIVLLREARRELSAQRLESALRILAAPELSRSRRAARMRAQALQQLHGRAPEPLAADPAPAESPAASNEPRDDPSLRRLLSEMRRQRSSAPPRTERRVSTARPRSTPAGPQPRFMLGVDDSGEFLVACASELVIGHARGGSAGLPFLADVETEHARLAYSPGSFHAGPSWSIEALDAREIRLGGRPLAGSPRELAEGDQVQLASNLGFRFRLPDSSSSSAVLELENGAECAGAMRILLLAPAPAGRATIGLKASAHVPAPSLDPPIELELEGARLWLSSETGLRRLGGDEDGSPLTRLAVDLPPSERVDLTLARSRGPRPLGLSIRPVP
ncbi:MAG TPA: hypothetical protein VMS76_06580 [Planctomycetota bacterium]|nr:hypothetical protein [Planctomycetota bacterium]